MDNKDFWVIYYEHLEMVAGLAGKYLNWFKMSSLSESKICTDILMI